MIKNSWPERGAARWIAGPLRFRSSNGRRKEPRRECDNEGELKAGAAIRPL